MRHHLALVAALALAGCATFPDEFPDDPTGKIVVSEEGVAESFRAGTIDGLVDEVLTTCDTALRYSGLADVIQRGWAIGGYYIADLTSDGIADICNAADERRVQMLADG